MAANRKASGQRIKILTASAAITSGKPVAQEGFVGIALDTIASGAAGQMAIEGIWKIAVPASTVKGDVLYAPSGSTMGATVTESADLTAALTRTKSATNAPCFRATTDRDSAGFAEVFILPPGAQTAAQQV